MQKLILASQSPRRMELLKQIGIIPDQVLPANIDESFNKNETSLNYVKRIACEKALKISKQINDGYILSADTIVISGGKILHKAKNNEEVEFYLKKLSGKSHRVVTAICLITPNDKIIVKTSTTRVKFKRINNLEIKKYISSNEGFGKAGGYAIQGLAGKFVKNINGSYSNVVGLDLYHTANLLEGNGYNA